MVAHGTQAKTEVKIMDESIRAYDTSVAGTRALELVLMKDKKRFKHTCAKINSVFYSMWIMLFKLHGMPPSDSINVWFLGFSMTLAFELIITSVFLLRILYPTLKVMSYGFPFLFILPGLTIVSPVWGLFGTLKGSP